MSVWEHIIDYLRNQESLYLLAQSRRSNAFKVVAIHDNAVIIQFASGNKLKLERGRFDSAYNLLEENKGNWVSIGAGRISANPDTLEGRIKADFNGQMNGTSTAPWIATILVGAYSEIEFNGKLKGQAIRMVR